MLDDLRGLPADFLDRRGQLFGRSRHRLNVVGRDFRRLQNCQARALLFFGLPGRFELRLGEYPPLALILFQNAQRIGYPADFVAPPEVADVHILGALGDLCNRACDRPERPGDLGPEQPDQHADQ